jgi:hypothetical protein
LLFALRCAPPTRLLSRSTTYGSPEPFSLSEPLPVRSDPLPHMVSECTASGGIESAVMNSALRRTWRLVVMHAPRCGRWGCRDRARAARS